MCAISPVDPNSFANVHEIQTRHVHLELDVDFSRRVLAGQARLSLQAVKEGVAEVVLDTNALQVKDVKLAQGTESLKYELGAKDVRFGSPLRVTLPHSCKQNDKVELVVDYETTQDSGALQWLQPKQTVGKQHP
ncbi:hypothetical protein THASP1DRAFT_20963, partial [Thamnocephalis sphaerospora]